MSQCSEQQLSFFKLMLTECQRQKRVCSIRFPTECGEKVKEECVRMGYETVVHMEYPNLAMVSPLERHVGLSHRHDVLDHPIDRMRWMLYIM